MMASRYDERMSSTLSALKYHTRDQQHMIGLKETRQPAVFVTDGENIIIIILW